MDIKITITDENDYELDTIKIYQDGSDSEGAALIRAYIEQAFPDNREKHSNDRRS